MVFAELKGKIEKVFPNREGLWRTLTITSLMLFLLLGKIKSHIVIYPIWCFCGLVFVILMSKKYIISNKVILWIGKNSLYFLLLQDISFTVCNYFGINCYRVPYVLVTVIFTACLTFVADRLFSNLDRHLFENDFVKKQGGNI